MAGRSSIAVNTAKARKMAALEANRRENGAVSLEIRYGECVTPFDGRAPIVYGKRRVMPKYYTKPVIRKKFVIELFWEDEFRKAGLI